MRWRVISSYPLAWRTWDDEEYVVYHPGSGDTHVLNAMSAELLRRMEDASTTRAELVSHCVEVLGIEPDEEFARQIDHLLNELNDLGLIEPAP